MTATIRDKTEEWDMSNAALVDIHGITVRSQPEPELGALAREAITKYFEAAATYIEEVGAKLRNEAISQDEQCKILATNLREMGKLESERVIAATSKARDAAKAIEAVSRQFSGTIPPV